MRKAELAGLVGVATVGDARGRAMELPGTGRPPGMSGVMCDVLGGLLATDGTNGSGWGVGGTLEGSRGLMLGAVVGLGIGFRLNMLAKVDGAEGEAGTGAMLVDVESGGMERDIAVVFGFGEVGFELDWRGGRLLVRAPAGAFVIREPVTPVSAGFTAAKAVDGDGGFGMGEKSLGSDWDELRGRPRRKEPRMVERAGGESFPAWGSIAGEFP